MGKFRNEKLKAKMSAITAPAPIKKAKTKTVAKPLTLKEKKEAAALISKPDTLNIDGGSSYKLDDHLRLLSMLNVLKLEPQYYKSESSQMKELKLVLHRCAKTDTYFTAQCIVYSRCVGEGMRSVNHLAAVYLAKHLSGKQWAQNFYKLWNKKFQKGGTVFRPDDISEIVACYTALNSKTITNAMKKGFATALEEMDAYSLLKYKSSLLDVINLVHPDPKKSKAKVDYNGKKVSVFEAIIKGYNVSADTWEVAQSDAGQEVAKAVKAGKITKTEAAVVLKEAKSDNWKGLLADKKLGALAAVRNIRSILSVSPDTETVNMLCNLLTDGDSLRQGKVMPYQLDLAYEVLKAEFSGTQANKISKALVEGYELTLPNLKEYLSGNNLVIIDISGSMNSCIIIDPNRKTNYKSTTADKAATIGATIAKATGADVILFGTTAKYGTYNSKRNVFEIATHFRGNMGDTDLSTAWRLAASSGKVYDRVFILSDNAINSGNTYKAYESYVTKVGDPYVYSIDLAAYGTTVQAGAKVRYYYGFGTSMFDDIATSEFNPMYHLEKVRKIVL